MISRLGDYSREPIKTLLAGRMHQSIHEAGRFYGLENKSIGRALNTHDPEVQVARLLLSKYLRSGAKDKVALHHAMELLSSVTEDHPLDGLASKIAGNHGVKITDIKGSSRLAKTVTARYDFIRKAYDCSCSLNDIALYLNRDHKTIHYALNKEK